MADLAIVTNSGTATFTEIGGQGTPQSPREWRITSAKPVFAQTTLWSYHRSVKNRDQLVIKIRVPYTVTNADTSQEEPVSFASFTGTFDLPRDLPQTQVENVVLSAATGIYHPIVSANLYTPYAARKPY